MDMSRAWYKPNVAPTLLRAFESSQPAQRVVEIWSTPCVVTRFGKTIAPAHCSILINPANPQLSGVSKFPYFPKGGPAPKEYPKKDAHHIMGHVSQWGGMEVGNGMMFAANVVDGLVHQLGGWRLAWEIRQLPMVTTNEQQDGNIVGDIKCPVGRAVRTESGSSALKGHFDRIVHTVPPFYRHHAVSPEQHLEECYHNALALAFDDTENASFINQSDNFIRVACPLLGAGCRGFPVDDAIQIAASSSGKWRDEGEGTDGGGTQKSPQQILAFGIPDPDIAQALVTAMMDDATSVG